MIDNQPIFTRVAKRPAVDIDFHDISFSAGGNDILRGVSGQFKAGDLSAILGPSGAGKSTLMNILAGYVTSGVKGCINTNGEPRRLKLFNKLSSYIMQDDILESFVTVREAMRLASHLKLGDELTHQQKNAAIEEILSTLGLSKCGDVFMDKLSGGQRKRVSISLELVNNPPVLFLDEPTTGLDIVSMNQVMDMLRLLARQGRTIVCTIHQPMASMFHSFDAAYIVARGQCVYQGCPSQLVPFLAQTGFPCPSTYNPADYIFEIMDRNTMDRMVEAIQNGKLNKTRHKPQSYQSQNSLLYKKDSMEELAPVLTAQTKLEFPTSFWKQFSLLLSLMFLQKYRNTAGTWLQLLHHVVSGLLIGTVFYNVGNNASRPIENFKFCLCVCVFFMYTHCMNPCIQFPIEMKVMKREFFNRWYSLKAFYAAKTCSSIPLIVVLGWLFTVIVYLMSDQPLEWKRFTWFAGYCTLLGIISEGLGMVIGFIFNCTKGAVVCPSLMAPILVLSIHGMGYGLQISWFMVWIMKLSYIRFGAVGLVTSLYLDNRTMECDVNDIYCFYKDPKLLVRDLAMQGHNPVDQLYGLIFYLFFFRVMAFIALRFRVSTEFSHQVVSYVNKIIKTTNNK